ncbi:cytosolic invertase 2 [Dorcoceras hygrometricum]|uniref:Cytosolic invertase 2 n=1 Tax=Dorcoceras hygrometricum TaxID=472368 RepID=A0A2Z7BH16_9LAMI|nr:cytosolic invertase 2 [Dorcoceras hygrometricum]
MESGRLRKKQNLIMKLVLQHHERHPTTPELPIKPEPDSDSTSITDYLESSSDLTIHQKKNFPERTMTQICTAQYFETLLTSLKHSGKL